MNKVSEMSAKEMCISVDQNLLVLLNNSKILNEETIERFKQMNRIVTENEDKKELEIIKEIMKKMNKINTDQ